MSHLMRLVLVTVALTLAYLPGILAGTLSIFEVSHERLRIKEPFLKVPDIPGKIEELLKRCVKFKNLIILNGAQALRSAHPRNELIAKSILYHILVLNIMLEKHLESAYAHKETKNFLVKDLQLAYLLANKAAQYHLIAHFPCLNPNVAINLTSLSKQLLSVFGKDQITVMVKAQLNLAKIVPLLQIKNKDQAAWMGNFLSLAVVIGDVLSTFESAEYVLLTEDDLYSLSHPYRFINFMTKEKNAGVFMNKPIMQSVSTFVASLNQLESFLAGSLENVTDPTFCAFLKADKLTRAQYKIRLASVGHNKVNAFDTDKIVSQIVPVQWADESVIIKHKKKISISSTKDVKTVEIKAEVDSEEVESEEDGDEEDDEEEDEGGSYVDEPLVETTTNVPQVGLLPLVEPSHLPYDERDIRYAYLLIGEFIYDRYLKDFLLLFRWKTNDEVIWSDVLTLLDDAAKNKVVHNSIKKCGMNPDFFRKAVKFYQLRNEIGHPILRNYGSAEVTRDFHRIKNSINPAYLNDLRSFFHGVTIGNEEIDLLKPYRDVTPRLSLKQRPKNFQHPDVVEATFSAIHLYQSVYVGVILPLLRNLGIRKVEKLNRLIFSRLEQDQDTPLSLEWKDVCALVFGLGRRRNEYGHPKINPRMVKEYLMIFRDHPDWNSFYAILMAKAISEERPARTSSRPKLN